MSMLLPEVLPRPPQRYSHGRLIRGARRANGPTARTLALFDTIGIRKRSVRTHLTLSATTYDALKKRADAERIPIATLAAYIVEITLREEGA